MFFSQQKTKKTFEQKFVLPGNFEAKKTVQKKSHTPKIQAVLMLAFFLISNFAFFTHAAPNNQIALSAYVLTKNNLSIPNGQYSIRFAIYNSDRQTLDPYPSNSDPKVWQETQTIQVNDGLISAYPGAVTPLPTSLAFSNNTYYLGIQINQDSEMVPRKKIGSVPVAIDSTYLQGKTLGNQAGNIPLLTAGGGLEEGLTPPFNKTSLN